jgi:hypothetical protein
MLDVMLITASVIGLFYCCLPSRTSAEAPFSGLLLFLTSSAFVHTLIRQTKIHTHTKQEKSHFCLLKSSRFSILLCVYMCVCVCDTEMDTNNYV